MVNLSIAEMVHSHSRLTDIARLTPMMPRLAPACSLGSRCDAAHRRSQSNPAGGRLARKTSCSVVASRSDTVVGPPDAESWWHSHPELWVDIESEEQFRREVSDPAYELVFADFYATWCHGCRSVYPHLCNLAADEALSRRVKFIKINIDSLRQLMRSEGVKALPCVKLFRPSTGPLVKFQARPSRAKYLRTNVDVVLGNPHLSFEADPNGLLVPCEDGPSKEEERQRRQQELRQLQQHTADLHRQLMSSAAAQDDGAPVAREQPRASSRDGFAVDEHAVRLAKEVFLRQHADTYGYGGRIDALHAEEVAPRLGPGGHYLDFTGSSLYCKSQLQAAMQDMQQHLYGNPHSASPSSQLTEARVDECRELVLRFFNASPSKYHVVFTRSATASLQIVGETFPWDAGSTFRYLRENHNSVLGMRSYALSHGAHFEAVDEHWVDGWVSGDGAPGSRGDGSNGSGDGSAPTFSLFAFPAEENFAGVKYPLSWVRAVQAKSTAQHQWKVMLDAAAFVPTQPLDLQECPADFVALSFYKMFGYPTGLGALIVKTDFVEQLRKVFWGGGSVSMATSVDDFHVLKCKPNEMLEDGTLAFLDIISLQHGFAVLKKLGGVAAVQKHVHSLTRHLYSRLAAMRHSNGAPLVKVFGKHDQPDAHLVQGGIVNFEVLQPDGAVFSFKTVEREAAAAGFHIRTGAECNPGACYRYVGVEESEVEKLAGEKEGCDDDIEFLEVEAPAHSSNGGSLQLLLGARNDAVSGAAARPSVVKVPLGSVRVSLGHMSTFEDVESFALFLEATYRDR